LSGSITAAGGEDDAVQTGQALDGLLFSEPKSRLALFLEDKGDIDAGFRFDIGVAVVKRESKQACQLAAHGGLAGAHGSDEEDVSLGKHDRRS